MTLNDADFRDAAHRAGMSYYPWEPLPAELSEIAGDALTDRGVTRINRDLPARQAVLTYLHEACHLIAHRYRLDNDAEGWTPHTPHFAALVAVCYKRIDRLHMLKLYDFGDAADVMNGKPINQIATGPSPGAMARRLNYVLRACEHYAGTDMTIEQIAASIAENRRAIASARETTQRRKARRENWIAGTVGVVLSLGVVVGAHALRLI
ncbi:hypothetical protein [Burkholderia ubonensis]|uniref:Uncharacterized protein n=1 Tax=Burkholderia ubonensis TaxID=101571 RepID=A0A1R1J887_9BURK|nr:hypothetical protein [Burkholderia ubonensis]OMG71388.1 hypothetical protein BW685_21335 [Burkholderia ubonensis]